MDNNTVAFELAKKYTFEKFDFQNGTPEELLALYQETENAINKVLNGKVSEKVNASTEAVNKANKWIY